MQPWTQTINPENSEFGWEKEVWEVSFHLRVRCPCSEVWIRPLAQHKNVNDGPSTTHSEKKSAVPAMSILHLHTIHSVLFPAQSLKLFCPERSWDFNHISTVKTTTMSSAWPDISSLPKAVHSIWHYPSRATPHWSPDQDGENPNPVPVSCQLTVELPISSRAAKPCTGVCGWPSSVNALVLP